MIPLSTALQWIDPEKDALVRALVEEGLSFKGWAELQGAEGPLLSAEELSGILQDTNPELWTRAFAEVLEQVELKHPRSRAVIAALREGIPAPSVVDGAYDAGREEDDPPSWLAAEVAWVASGNAQQWASGAVASKAELLGVDVRSILTGAT
jgi:hypothetical protein